LALAFGFLCAFASLREKPVLSGVEARLPACPPEEDLPACGGLAGIFLEHRFTQI